MGRWGGGGGGCLLAGGRRVRSGGKEGGRGPVHNVVSYRRRCVENVVLLYGGKTVKGGLGAYRTDLTQFVFREDVLVRVIGKRCGRLGCDAVGACVSGV